MKKTRYFQFSFPVTNLRCTPASHVGDLDVHAMVYQYKDGSLHMDPDDEKVTVDIDVIFWEGTNVHLLLDAVAEDLYAEIIEAARQHGVERFRLAIPETTEA